MKHYVRSIAGYLFSSIKSRLSLGEQEAIENLRTELRIARYHRQGLKDIKRMPLPHPLRLNLGSGNVCKESYLNVDLFPGADLTLDLRRGLPFASECCSTIFSEHCFEHFGYPESITHLLSECLRVLKPGGLLRFSVPDTKWPLLGYGEGGSYFRWLETHPGVHPAHCTTRLEHINFHFRQGDQHRFAYDEETAHKILKNVGFIDIERCDFDPEIDSSLREIGSLFITATKPMSAFEGRQAQSKLSTKQLL